MAFGTAETAKLIVDLSLTGNYAANLTKAQRGFSNLGKAITDSQGRAYKAGQQIGTGIKRGALIAVSALGVLTGWLALSVKKGQEAANVQKVYAQSIANNAKNAAARQADFNKNIDLLNRVLAQKKPGTKAYKDLAGQLASLKAIQASLGPVTAEQTVLLNAQQKALMNLAGVDDELIKSEQTRLIQMGFSGKAVADLTPLILDAAKATGKDLLTVTVAAGKAALGNAGALQRLGIMVDKTRFKANPLAETLRVLQQRFGGITQATSGSFDVRLAALRENLDNIAEDAGQKLLPALTRIVDVVGTQLVPAFGKFVDRILPTVIKGIDKFASLLENGGAEKGINAITDALIPLVDLVKIAAAPVKAIVGAFLSLPKELQTVLVGAFAVNKLTGGLVTNVFGGIAEAIAKSFIRAPLVNVQGGVVNVAGGPGGLPGAVGRGGGGFSLLGGLTAAGFGLAIAAAFKGTFQDPEFQKQTDAIDKSVKTQVESGAKLSDLLKTQAALKQGISDLTVQDKNGNPVPILNDIAGLLYGGQKEDLQKQLALVTAAIDAYAKSHPVYGPPTTRPAPKYKFTPELAGSPKNKVPFHNRFTDWEQTGKARAAAGLFGAEAKAQAKNNRKPVQTEAKAQAKNNRKPVQTEDIENLRARISDGLHPLATAKDITGLNPRFKEVGSDALQAGARVVAAVQGIQAPVTNVNVDVSVTPGGIKKIVTVQGRYGPATGSAQSDLNAGTSGHLGR